VAFGPDPSSRGWNLKRGLDGSLWAWYGTNFLHREGGQWITLSNSAGPVPGSSSNSFAIDHIGTIRFASSSDSRALSYIPSPAQGGAKIRTFASGGEIGVATGIFFGADQRGHLWRGSPVGV
jgi:hypothetical protein